MLLLATHRDFDRWRKLARGMLVAGVPPRELLWSDEADANPLLGVAADPVAGNAQIGLAVPREFLNLAKGAACFREPDRWNLLYRVLWRLTHGEKSLLERFSDDDVSRLHAMQRAVSRDRHKMTAFVRFRAVEREGVLHYVAWHRPDHYIVRLAAPFFADRFATMNWTILTPDDSVAWDGQTLRFFEGVPIKESPADDGLEGLWLTYYANIFNPARVKVDAMKKEMPVRHWSTLPEAELIPDLLHNAPKRVEEMIRKAKENARPSGKRPGLAERAGRELSAGGVGLTRPRGAEDFVPSSASLKVLAAASKGCEGCDLCRPATQTVFGEGPADAELIFVGEQPGDQEDLAGRPFVGPAGQLLSKALEEVGIVRADCYVTNTVKHFKFEQRGPRRIHAKPSSREVSACMPWLEAEIHAIKPKMLVCLGSTAAQALLGRDFRVTTQHGQPAESEWAAWTMATIHPSALLRIPDETARKQAHKQFLNDLRLVADEIRKKAG